MLSYHHKSKDYKEEFDLNRLKQIADDVKRNYRPNDDYSDLEKKLWELMDSCVESGYDMCMKLHTFD